MKVLVGITKGREVPGFPNAVKEALDSIDKYWVCYYPQEIAFNLIRKYFLEHGQYTHMCLLPDDLLVTKKAFDRLIADISRYDLNNVSGCCNVDIVDNPEALAICKRPVMAARASAYRWIYKDTTEYAHLMQWNEATDHPIEVSFVGFPLTIIRRDVVDRFPFRSEIQDKCQDVAWCKDMMEAGIPIWVDLRAEMYHVKISDAVSQAELKVGLRKCDTYLEEGTGNVIKYDAPDLSLLQKQANSNHE